MIAAKNIKKEGKNGRQCAYVRESEARHLRVGGGHLRDEQFLLGRPMVFRAMTTQSGR